jgi:hypothetical protein
VAARGEKGEDLATDTATTFHLVPLEPGQKIRILGVPRGGDWLVLDADDRKMRVRRPVSGKEVEWDRFLTVAEVLESEEWPKRKGN